MTEIIFTEEEVSKILNDVFGGYVQHYQADKMNFNDFVIIENLMMKLQNEFRMLSEKKGVEIK